MTEPDLTTRTVAPHPRWGIGWLLPATLSAAALAVLVWLAA